MFKQDSNIRVWNQYLDVLDITSVAKAVQYFIDIQNQDMIQIANLGSFYILGADLLDWVAEKQWNVTRPTLYVSTNLFDVGRYDVAKWDGDSSTAKINDNIFKKYIFWIIRRDQEWFNIPFLITQIVDFCEISREEISITVTGKNINIKIPANDLTEYFYNLNTLGYFVMPISFNLTVELI